jgi:hypothetical protein
LKTYRRKRALATANLRPAKTASQFAMVSLETCGSRVLPPGKSRPGSCEECGTFFFFRTGVGCPSNSGLKYPEKVPIAPFFGLKVSCKMLLISKKKGTPIFCEKD